MEKLQNVRRLLTGTSRSLSKGVKPEGEDSPSNGDYIAAEKFLSVLPRVKISQVLSTEAHPAPHKPITTPLL